MTSSDDHGREEEPRSRIDLRKLRELRDQFADCAKDARLFHATRVMVMPDDEKPNDVSRGWDEFLGDQVTFGHSAFRLSCPPKRIQHLCFSGGFEVLNQFTGLAAQTAIEIPMPLLPRISPDPKDREARYDRDQWLLAMYAIAYRRRDLLPVRQDLQRNGEGTFDEVDRGSFDPLAFAANYESCERHGFATWKDSFTARNERCPRYLYAALSLDVCKCSVIAIDHVIETHSHGTLRLVDVPDGVIVPWVSTEAPATEAPATEAPTTETLATEVPATVAPVTEAPATETPATEVPATEAPATVAPVTEAPTTEDSATNAAYLGIRFNKKFGLVSRDGYKHPHKGDEDKTVGLSLILKRLFKSLLQEQGELVTYDVLGNAWPTQVDLADKSEDIRKIQTEIGRLRKKLTPLGLVVESKRLFGYRLIDKTRARKPRKRRN